MHPKLRAAALLACSLAATAAFAQAQTTQPSPPNQTQPQASTPAATPAPPAFEVVSIHPIPLDGPRGTGLGVQPNGFHMRSTISLILQIAYFPPNDWNRETRIQGGPSWLFRDPYDITTRVADADLPEWTRQRDLKPEQQILLHQMLQSMLADRCKLAAHRVPSTIDGFALVVGKRGPHLTPSTPGAPLPSGMKLPDGGVTVPRQRGGPPEIHFYNVTMADLAGALSGGSMGHPILDKTGLTGHYDIVLPYDYDPAISPVTNWDVNTLGLRLEPIKIPFYNLVIDHIEKPSDN